MPSNTSHRIFGKTVVDKLPTNISNKLNKELSIYNVFCQSFDNFFYYNIFSLKKGKYIRDFGHYCHKHKTQTYLINIIKYIEKNNLKNNYQCLAYLYGSINHYVMDTIFHPYVFYKTGSFNKKKKETYKYNSLHTKIENMLDKYFYESINNKNYKYYRHYKDNFPKIKFSPQLKNTINYAFSSTYKKDNLADIYLKSFNQGRFIFRFGVFDRFGIKKAIYKFADIIRPIKYRKAIYVSTFINKIDNNYLNLEKNDWYNSKSNIYSNLSVDELYELAVETSVTLIKTLDKMLHTKINYNKLKILIPNISYINGRELNEKYKFSIFEI